LTNEEKLVSLRVVRGFLGVEDRSGASQSDQEVFQPEKTKARSRSYSGVLYEYRVERSRATRGATQCGWLRPALDAGFFILQQWLGAVASGKKFRKGFPKRVAGQLNHEAKSQETGAELEG